MSESTKSVGPITPAEARSRKAASIPPEVFEAFNKRIVENLMPHGEAVFTQDSVLDIVLKDVPEMDRSNRRHELFELGYLDVEDVYRAAGWKVDYDKTGYVHIQRGTTDRSEEVTDERQKWKNLQFAEHYSVKLKDLWAKLPFAIYEQVVLPDSETLRRMASSVKRAEINTKENKELTEEKQSPVFDSLGVEVRGDVKEVYSTKSMSKTYSCAGLYWFTSQTECGRDVVQMRHLSGTYEVAIFLNGKFERGYRGKKGSDAHRVYNGALLCWRKFSGRGNMLRLSMAAQEDMRFIDLVVPEGEHCLPPEAVPTRRETK